MRDRDKDSFRQFCQNATDHQLVEIHRKEKWGSEFDRDREVCAEIARAEAERRRIQLHEK